MRSIQKSVVDALEKEIEESKKAIKDAISPHVIFCPGIDQVRKEAAALIRRAADEYDVAIRKRSNTGGADGADVEPLPEFFITIYGAASLGNRSDADESISKKESVASIKEYEAALAFSETTNIEFRRYVSLMTADQYENRSDKVKNEYADWLNSQIEQIQKDPNYTLIISPRAPQWGTSNTTFLTRQGLIEVKGHGNAAFVIDDTRIAIRMRASLRQDIYQALPSNVTTINSKRDTELEWFKNQIREINGLTQTESDVP